MRSLNNRYKSVYISMLIIVVILSGILAGCSSNSKPKKDEEPPEVKVVDTVQEETPKPETKIITDMVGREVKIPYNVEKVVNVGPVGVLNSFVFAIGEGEKIANGLPPNFTKTDRWKYHAIFYPSIADKPVVEDINRTIAMEELISIDPDLVFVMNKETADEISGKGLNAIVLNWTKPEDVKEVVNLLGEIFNKQERAESYSKYFDETLSKVEKIASEIPEKETVTALNTALERLSQPHLIAEWWIEAAGGKSVSNDGRDIQTLNYTLEELLKWDPEIMIVSSNKDLELAYGDEKFKDISAVKNKKIYITPVMGHVWANRTIEQPLTVLWAAKLFYPEQFKDINLNEEVKYFAKTFFDYNLSDEECKDILGNMD